MLYRYFNSHALESLQANALKVSRVSEYNDPFDTKPQIVGVMTRAKARETYERRLQQPDFIARCFQEWPQFQTVDALLTHLDARKERTLDLLMLQNEDTKRAFLDVSNSVSDKHLRVVCFSADALPRNEVLLWSHYADHHKGCRIGFNFPKDKPELSIEPVTYQDKRAELDVTIDPEGPEFLQMIRRNLRIKSTAWSYEHEHRLITIPQRCFSVQTHPSIELIRLDPEWVRRVDFGARFDQLERAKFIASVSNSHPHATFFQSWYHPSEFALCYDAVPSG
jgi:hypothetical protein